MKIFDYSYTVFPAHRKNFSVWCYQVTLPSGKTENRKTTRFRFTTKAEEKRTYKEAVAFVEGLILNRHILKDEDNTIVPTLKQWVKEYRWWQWGKCHYIRNSIARSEAGRPKIVEGTAKTNLRILEKQILPSQGSLRIDAISPAILEKLLFSWTRKVSYKTANNFRSVYSSMLGEAARLKIIPRNPWDDVPSLVPRTKRFGALTMAEAQELLDRDNLEKLWKNKEFFYLITKLSFLAGLRVSEALGLQIQDFKQEKIKKKKVEITYYYIAVTKQWIERFHRTGPTKDKDSREIPLCAELYKELVPFLDGNPTNYVFSLDRGHSPLSMTGVRKRFYYALEKIGILDHQKEKRNITFHSGRRFANTMWRMGGVPDPVLRRWTGHDDEEMTEHYTDYLAQDLDFIAHAQNRWLNPPSK